MFRANMFFRYAQTYAKFLFLNEKLFLYILYFGYRNVLMISIQFTEHIASF